MIQLWVDDVRPAPGPDWTIARTSAEAIQFLRTGRVEVVSFDHDLGGDDTSMRAIDWLDEAVSNDPEFRAPRVQVHSSNPVGARRIRAAVESMNRRRR
jgi:hypothetical protein